MIDKQRFLSVKEAAEVLQVSKGTIYKYCKSEIIPHYKMLGNYRFIKSELEEFIKKAHTINN